MKKTLMEGSILWFFLFANLIIIIILASPRWFLLLPSPFCGGTFLFIWFCKCCNFGKINVILDSLKYVTFLIFARFPTTASSPLANRGLRMGVLGIPTPLSPLKGGNSHLSLCKRFFNIKHKPQLWRGRGGVTFSMPLMIFYHPTTPPAKILYTPLLLAEPCQLQPYFCF